MPSAVLQIVLGTGKWRAKRVLPGWWNGRHNGLKIRWAVTPVPVQGLCKIKYFCRLLLSYIDAWTIRGPRFQWFPLLLGSQRQLQRLTSALCKMGQLSIVSG